MTVREKELRSRVERLLREDIRLEDVSRLLLWLRFRTYGGESIKELGHFISHSDERRVGLVTNEARDFFFLLPFHAGENAPIYLADVSEEFPGIIARNLNRISSDDIKRFTGMKKQHAAAILNSLIRKFSPAKHGRCSLQTPLTTQEQNVLICAIGHLRVRPAFTDDSLFRDFVFALERNNLISVTEKPLLNKTKSALALFAIATMHHTKLALEGDGNADLIASSGEAEKGMLQVVAVGACPMRRTGGSFLFSTAMFSTSLTASDHCAPELLSFPDGGNLWHGPIELRNDLKLSPL
jgi:hypothetical protein